MRILDDWSDDGYRVETPEGIDLDYDLAGVGSRFLATLIDTPILAILVVLVVTLGTLGIVLIAELLAGLAGLRIDRDTSLATGLAVSLFLSFALIWGYYVFFEWVWEGRTPGKRVTGLRVIKEGGYPLGFLDVVIRNVIRFIDFLPLYYMIGAGVMLFDKRSRRLGDLVAGTVVVKERGEIRLASLSAGVERPTETAAAATPLPEWARLTPAEESLLRDFLDRRPTLFPETARNLSDRLAKGYARRLDHDLAGESPDAFLRRLAGRLY